MNALAKTTSLFLLLMLVITMGCVSVQDISTSKDKTMYSRIRIISEGRAGNVVTKVTIDKVDDESTDISKTYVAVDPGRHVLTLRFRKEIRPSFWGGLTISLCVNGAERIINSPEPTKMFYSIIPEEKTFLLLAGKTYRLISTDNLAEVPGDQLSPWGSPRVSGSWDCTLREEK